ncbi:hypothetical protein D3C73_1159270 [compost metagenome]
MFSMIRARMSSRKIPLFKMYRRTKSVRNGSNFSWFMMTRLSSIRLFCTTVVAKSAWLMPSMTSGDRPNIWMCRLRMVSSKSESIGLFCPSRWLTLSLVSG